MRKRHARELKLLGTFIRERRESVGLSQEHLGKHLGVSQAAISRIEAGTQQLSFLQMVEAAQVLDFGLAEAAEAVLNVAEKKGGQLK